MAGKADVQTHLLGRRQPISSTLAAWTATSLTPTQRADLVTQYLESTGLGSVQRVGATSALMKSVTGDPRRVNVLVIGRHDTAGLSNRLAVETNSELPAGPGTASRLGSTMAFIEGAGAAAALTPNDPVNVNVLSLGEGDDFATIAPRLFTGNVDAVFITNAVAWNPNQPTITTGARGQVTAELSLNAGRPTPDFLTAGAVRNPLTKLTQILGSLRDGTGRITLPGFYERAQSPSAQARTALSSDSHDPDAWTKALGATPLAGSLSSLERVALWPSVNVLSVKADTNDAQSSPGAATATIGLYLIPDQRHAEIERSLRTWFTDAAPANLRPAVTILSSSRPYRSPTDSVPVAAQARAAFRLTGRQPIMVASGGPAGAGELAFAVGAPVAFAGMAPATSEFGSATEPLSWTEFDVAADMASETILQLRRS